MGAAAPARALDRQSQDCAYPSPGYRETPVRPAGCQRPDYWRMRSGSKRRKTQRRCELEKEKDNEKEKDC